MKERKIWHLYAAATILLLVLSGIVLHSRNGLPSPSKQPQSSIPTAPQGPIASSTPRSLAPNPLKIGEPESVEELSALIRKLSAQGGDTNALYARILAMRLPQKSWWRSATDFSSLLALANDAAVSEAGKVVALRLFLAGVPKADLEKQSDSLQAMFSDASDLMIGVLLQGMADRHVSPSTLIQQTLTNPQREQNTKCLAWYAARLTDPANPTFASLAISDADAGATTSSKVAFDYLAAAPHSAQFAADPGSQKSVDKLVDKAISLPADAGIIEMANADALISALPKIMDENRAKETFFTLLESAPNPEVRLSALDQIIILQTSGKQDLSAELHSIRKNIRSLFPNDSMQIRANARLNRIQ